MRNGRNDWWRNKRTEQSERRWLLAEENARNAEQTRDAAVRARTEIARQLDRLYVGQGTVLLESGDYSGALIPFVRALSVANREKLPEATHRLRIAALLSRLPHPLSVQINKKGDVKSVRFSADGKRILVVGADGVVTVRGADTAKILGKRLVHGAAVAEAVFSPDGAQVLSRRRHGTLTLVEDRGRHRGVRYHRPRSGSPVPCFQRRRQPIRHCRPRRG